SNRKRRIVRGTSFADWSRWTSESGSVPSRTQMERNAGCLTRMANRTSRDSRDSRDRISRDNKAPPGSNRASATVSRTARDNKASKANKDSKDSKDNRVNRVSGDRTARTLSRGRAVKTVSVKWGIDRAANRTPPTRTAGFLAAAITPAKVPA